jgi:hypothetical protein
VQRARIFVNALSELLSTVDDEKTPAAGAEGRGSCDETLKIRDREDHIDGVVLSPRELTKKARLLLFSGPRFALGWSRPGLRRCPVREVSGLESEVRVIIKTRSRPLVGG